MSQGQSNEDQAGDRDWTRRSLLMSAAGVGPSPRLSFADDELAPKRPT